MPYLNQRNAADKTSPTGPQPCFSNVKALPLAVQRRTYNTALESVKTHTIRKELWLYNI